MQNEWLSVGNKTKQREENRNFKKNYRSRCGGHFAKMFANFKDFSGELLVFEVFWGMRKISGVSRSEVQIPVFHDSWNSRSL